MKSIFLVNPISGRGHLDSYARLYSRALLELGYRVVLLAAADGGTTDYVMRNTPDLMPFFSFVSFNEARDFTPPPRPFPARSEEPAPVCVRSQMNVLRRARLVWCEEGGLGILDRCIRVPPRILRRVIPERYRVQIARGQRAIGRIVLQNRLARKLNIYSYLDTGRLRFLPLANCVENAAFMPRHREPDLVLFLYLDLMAERAHNVAPLDRKGAAPWIGILFHPRRARAKDAAIEGYFASKNARGGVFLVPPAIAAYAEATPQLHFALAPDVADLELPLEPSDLGREMRKRAGERTIVLQIGSITAHKGIPTLLDVIAAADPNRFFFALIGEVHWGTFGKDKGRIRSFYENPPENVLLSQGYIDSERTYNSIIAAGDIVYAVYEGFGSSSNSLTKAAGLGRPILVSDGSLMGQRVRRSNIGAAAPEGDAAAILDKLCWLATQPKAAFGFAAFSDEHSLEALKRVLRDALPRWTTGRVNADRPYAPALLTTSDT